MSLNWSMKDVRNYKQLFSEFDSNDTCIAPAVDRFSIWRDSMIWATMFVGLGSVSEKNIDEWLWRLAFRAQLGRFVSTSCMGEEINPDREVLERFIGLSTNASNMTRNQFVKKQLEILQREVKQAVSLAAEKLAAETPEARQARRVAADFEWSNTRAEKIAKAQKQKEVAK